MSKESIVAFVAMTLAVVVGIFVYDFVSASTAPKA